MILIRLWKVNKMTKYYVYFVQCEFIKFRKAFDDKAETIRYVKDELCGTDGSFAFQIIGFDDNGSTVYSKTYTAENHKAKAV